MPKSEARAASRVAAKPAAKAAAKSAATGVVKAVKPVAKPGVTRAVRAAKKTVHTVPAPFTGFPKDFLVFFREIAKNNDREWFAANKERYQTSVQAPMLSFIAAMDLPLGRVADCFVADARPQGGSMFRIYRDTRFSRDKTPYKDFAACQFRHMAGKDAHAPGFYLQIEPKEVFFGGGIWRPPGPELRAIREAIEADPERWKKITRSAAFRRRFGGVEGDALKRPPQGFDPEHPLIDDLKRTSFFAVETVKPTAILSKDFARDVARSFEALAPFMEFLTEAVGFPFHHDD